MKLLWLTIYFTGLIGLLIYPHEYFTWFLEAAPALIGFGIFAWTYNCQKEESCLLEKSDH